MGRTVEVRRVERTPSGEYGPVDPYARIRELSIEIGKILQDGDMDPSIIVDVSLDNAKDPCIYLYGDGSYSIERDEDDRQKAHLTTVLIEFAKIRRIPFDPKTIVNLFTNHLVEQEKTFSERAERVKNKAEIGSPIARFITKLVGKRLFPMDD